MTETSNRKKEIKTRILTILLFLLIFLILLVVNNPEVQQKDSWEEIANNSWEPRGNHQTLVFKDKIWIIGGVTSTGISKRNQFINYSLACDDCEDSSWDTGDLNLNDVWYSTDGINWAQATESAPWSSRRNHTAVVFDNKMWVLGGYGDKNLNDVWYSTDGINWAQATESAQWSPRRGHTSVVFNNKIWVIGGAGANSWDDNLNDVWYSTDGINWAQATESAQWSKRSFHSSVVFDNQIWLIGGWGGWGKNLNDVWYSTNGINWKESPADWEPRWGHTSTVFDNKMWVIGGNIHSENNGEKNSGAGDLNDMWYSADGVKWTKFEKDIPWKPRRALRSLAFKNKLWIIGGTYGSINERISSLNDVWRLSFSNDLGK